MILAIIQARSKNKRLPGKVLMKLGDKTVLQHCYERVKKAMFVNNVVIAIPFNDDRLKKHCILTGMEYYEGSETDLLNRYLYGARLFNASHIVRITSDCPCIEPILIDLVIKRHLGNNNDITTNALTDTFPDGLDVAIMSRGALERAHREAFKKSDREHVVTYLYNNDSLFQIEEVKSMGYHKDIRLTIDYKKDYNFLKKLFNGLYKEKQDFDITDIYRYLEKNPKLLKINNCYKRNEGYQKSLEEDNV